MGEDDETPNVQRPSRAATQRRAYGGWRSIPTALMFLAGLAAVALWTYFLIRAGDEGDPFSQLEQMFFGTYTLLVGAIASWLISAHYARLQARDSFQQLARPALRRVLTARDSARDLLSAIDRRRSWHGGNAATTFVESLDSLYELVTQHARVLDDAVLDWRDVLPEDVRAAEVDEGLRRLLDGVVEEVTTSKIAHLSTKLDELMNKQVADPELLAAKIGDLKAELSQLINKQARSIANLHRKLETANAYDADLEFEPTEDVTPIGDLLTALRQSIEAAKRARGA